METSKTRIGTKVEYVLQCKLHGEWEDTFGYDRLEEAIKNMESCMEHDSKRPRRVIKREVSTTEALIKNGGYHG